MKDLRDLVPTNGQGGKRDPEKERDCSVCHESWTIPPTSQEVKRGVIDALMVCLAKPIQQMLPDGVYPRIASICRSDKKLCGGKFWKPIGQPLIADAKPFYPLRPVRETPEEKMNRKQGQFGRKPKVETVSKDEDDNDNENRRKKGKDRFRKPYEVS